MFASTIPKGAGEGTLKRRPHTPKSMLLRWEATLKRKPHTHTHTHTHSFVSLRLAEVGGAVVGGMLGGPLGAMVGAQAKGGFCSFSWSGFPFEFS